MVIGCLCCDLLSFYYLCRTGNNGFLNLAPVIRVVICFHFTIFVVLETTYHGLGCVQLTLWFAFILLSLSYWKQLTCTTDGMFIGCDLLSFYYLCRTGNNYVQFLILYTMVVICFHFTIFVVLETTIGLQLHQTGQLWFAFILLSLSYWKQPSRRGIICPLRCDLLSFYYLCRTGNNNISLTVYDGSVVICFHFTIFVVLETTPSFFDSAFAKLWFAFILLSLSYWKQRRVTSSRPARRCDLLSFYYLCRTGNNFL